MGDVNSQLDQVQSQKQQALNIINQGIPERRYGSPITADVQGQYVQQYNQAKQNLITLNTQEQQLKDFKANQDYNGRYQQGYDLGRKAILEKKFIGKPSDPAAQAGYAAGIKGAQAQLRNTEGVDYNLTQKNAPSPIVNSQGKVIYESVPSVNAPANSYVQPTFMSTAKDLNTDVFGNTDGNRLLSGISSRSSNYNNRNSMVDKNNIPIPKGQVNSIQASNPIESFQNFLNANRKDYGPLVGAGQVAADFLELTANLVTHPILTVENTGIGLFNIGKGVVGEGFPEAGQVLQQEPGYAISYLLGNYLAFKAPDFLVKGVDIARTINLEKLQATDVIAPEFFQGQIYPKIFKGQTPGQLLEEFKPLLPGEIKAGGYTAAPSPFTGELIGKGSSELPALYQAPKLSPTFLGISGESNIKLFSLDIIPTLEPSAFRTIPTSIELVPSISSSQTNTIGGFRHLSSEEIKLGVNSGFEGSKFAPVNQVGQDLLDFFKNSAEKGKSYIPFSKNEKESLLAFDTKVIVNPKRFFFEFSSRRVPIYELGIANDQLKVLSKSTDISKSTEIGSLISRYNKPSYPGIVNPYSSFVSLSSIKYNSYKSPYKPAISNIVFFSKISYRQLPSQSTRISPSSFISKPILSSISIPSISNPRSYSSINFNSRSSSRTPPNYPRIIYPNIPSGLKRSDFISKNNKNNKKSSNQFGYRTFVKEFGKIKFLPGLREKGSAERYGQFFTERTLRATFGVTKTNRKITATPTLFTPDNRIFRNYKISKGRAVPLQDTFIQRRGKRLNFAEEVSAIQSARKIKISKGVF